MVLCGLALSSCEKEPKHESYYVLYFSAHVVDEDGNPIQGICAYPETSAFYGRTGWEGAGQAKAVIFTIIVAVLAIAQMRLTNKREVQQ